MQTTESSETKRGRTIIIASPSSPPIFGLDKNAQEFGYLKEFLDYYFVTRCEVKPVIMEVAEALTSGGCRIILCAKEQAARAGAENTLEDVGDDGFCLYSAPDKTGGAVIFCAAANVRGMKYGLYRLINECRYSDRTLSLSKSLRTAIKPLIPNRVLMVAATYAGCREKERYFLHHWNDEKIISALKMYDSFGYNAVEKSVNYANVSGAAAQRQNDFSEKLLRANRRLGNKNIVILWGAAMWGKFNFCLSAPEGEKFAGDKYEATAGRYAKLADAVITHWADPGGCREKDCACNVNTPQEYHMRVREIFRRHNPEIETFFSLWFFMPTVGKKEKDMQPWDWHWKNTRSVDDILNSGILSNDVGIWVGVIMRFGQDGEPLLPWEHQSGCPDSYADMWNLAGEQMQKAIARKRKLGVWMWYFCDYETDPGLHISYRKVGEYFKRYQAQAGSEYAGNVLWHQCEQNRWGDWNTITHFVAGNMMLDPGQDAEDLARAFCADIMGEKNADKVKNALDAIERTRCFNHSCSHCGEGSDDPAKDLEIARNALRGLEEVSLDPAHIPRIPYAERVFDPAVMLEDLKINLGNIEKYNRARLEVQKLKTTAAGPHPVQAGEKEKYDALLKGIEPAFDTELIGDFPEVRQWKKIIDESVKEYHGTLR